jgi:predicted ArsR family transcriptional regulator
MQWEFGEPIGTGAEPQDPPALEVCQGFLCLIAWTTPDHYPRSDARRAHGTREEPAMRWWDRHFGESTRGRVVALLRRGRRSVDEIAAALSLTDNAVRAQLATLERDGIVTPVGPRREGAVGKPATLYAMAPEAGVVFSTAYAPVLAALVTELGARLPVDELDEVLRAAGRRLAPEVAGGSLERRAEAAAALLGELGADADLVRAGAGFDIVSHGCPLAQVVAARPEMCGAVEELLAGVTGARVRERCDRSGEPRCAFEIRAR